MANYINKWTTTFLALLIGLILLAYSNTLHAPFNFDDEAVVKFETVDVHKNISRALPSTGVMKILYDYSYPPRYRQLFYSNQYLMNPFVQMQHSKKWSKRM